MIEKFKRTDEVVDQRVNVKGSGEERAGFLARLARLNYEATLRGEEPVTIDDLGTKRFRSRKDNGNLLISALRVEAAGMARLTIAVPETSEAAAPSTGTVATQPPAPTIEGATSAPELSPEQQATLVTLKARYNKNANNIPCHESTPWARIEAKLTANPSKLATLKQMEDTGGAPDVYRVEGDDFIFGDLSKKAPTGRRNLTWSQAAANAVKIGAELMSPRDYLLLANNFGIRMDVSEGWSWLAGVTFGWWDDVGDFNGNPKDNRARVRADSGTGYDSRGSYRCSLRV